MAIFPILKWRAKGRNWVGGGSQVTCQLFVFVGSSKHFCPINIVKHHFFSGQKLEWPLKRSPLQEKWLDPMTILFEGLLALAFLTFPCLEPGNVLYFCGWALQNKVFSNQNKGLFRFQVDMIPVGKPGLPFKLFFTTVPLGSLSRSFSWLCRFSKLSLVPQALSPFDFFVKDVTPK